MKFSCFEIELGWVAIICSEAGLVRMNFPVSDERSAIDAISQDMEVERNEDAFAEIKNALKDYFNGKSVDFNFPLDLSNYTSFQRDVWEAAKKIPFGQLRSYGWLAAEIHRPRASRAVGQALGDNPLPIIIPCHRVVRSDGSLGGFSGGLDWKKRLIRLEKVVFGYTQEN
jgi:methylated-DNA-[protein]-cysteine S-methyltransferase